MSNSMFDFVASQAIAVAAKQNQRFTVANLDMTKVTEEQVTKATEKLNKERKTYDLGYKAASLALNGLLRSEHFADVLSGALSAASDTSKEKASQVVNNMRMQAYLGVTPSVKNAEVKQVAAAAVTA